MAAPYKASLCLATSNTSILPGSFCNDLLIYTGNSNQSILFGVSNVNTFMTVSGTGNLSFAGDVSFSNQLQLSSIMLTQRASAVINNVTSSITNVDGFSYLNGNIQITMSNNIGTNAIQFLQNNTEYMRISSNGNVGINISNPTEKLHVVGNIIATGSITGSGTNITSLNATNITTGTLAVTLGGTGTNDAFAGMVVYFAVSTVPSGWLSCDGSAVSRATYALLFSRIGTTWGVGNGSTTFNIPDLRGEFIRSWDAGRGVDTGRTFATAQSAAMLNHTHSGTTSTDPGHTHNIQLTTDGGANGAANGNNGQVAANLSTGIGGAHSHTFTTGNPSTGGSTETRPRNVSLLACIKF
jgi:microcystin-dependent protein